MLFSAAMALGTGLSLQPFLTFPNQPHGPYYQGLLRYREHGKTAIA